MHSWVESGTTKFRPNPVRLHEARCTRKTEAGVSAHPPELRSSLSSVRGQCVALREHSGEVILELVTLLAHHDRCLELGLEVFNGLTYGIVQFLVDISLSLLLPPLSLQYRIQSQQHSKKVFYQA